MYICIEKKNFWNIARFEIESEFVSINKKYKLVIHNEFLLQNFIE